MHMRIVFAYVIVSQAIRHQVMGPSGMSKDVRFSGSQQSNCREPINWYLPYTKNLRFGALALLDVFFASSK